MMEPERLGSSHPMECLDRVRVEGLVRDDRSVRAERAELCLNLAGDVHVQIRTRERPEVTLPLKEGRAAPAEGRLDRLGDRAVVLVEVVGLVRDIEGRSE